MLPLTNYDIYDVHGPMALSFCHFSEIGHYNPLITFILKLHSPMTFECLHYFEINISNRPLSCTIH